MPKPDGPAEAVLPDAVTAALNDEPLLAAVFTTFQLEPRFFEDHVLGRLLGLVDRGSDKVRRAIVRERLRDLEPTLVLYDPRGLLTQGGPAVQAVEYVPVKVGGGCFHCKHVLLLVGSRSAPTGLLLLTTSANLTQSGWWKNVECADLQWIPAARPSPLKADLLELLGDLMSFAGSDRRHEGLAAMSQFVQHLPDGAKDELPRLWTGRERLDRFLAAHLEHGGTLECFAPFVDAAGLPVTRLVGALAPDKGRVMLPVDRENAVTAGPAWLTGVADAGLDLASVRVDRSLGARADGSRFVHAKVIRLRRGRRAWTLIGSPNLSIPGHAGWRSGASVANVETAILVETEDSGPWLQGADSPINVPPASITPPEDREEELARTPARVRVDWAARQVWLRLDGVVEGPVSIGRPGQSEASRAPLCSLEPGPDGTWIQLVPVDTDVVLEHLARSNILTVWCSALAPKDLLVEETGLAEAPCRVDHRFTPAEILEHWSLLTDRERQHHTIDILGGRSEPDPESPIGGGRRRASDGRTMFDAFAGVVHAFLTLRERLLAELEAERLGSVAALVLGKGPDSLPSLLESLEERQGLDPVYHLLALLCADEVWRLVKADAPALSVEHPHGAKALEALLQGREEHWSTVLQDTDDLSPEKLRAWFEGWFVRPVVQRP